MAARRIGARPGVWCVGIALAACGGPEGEASSPAAGGAASVGKGGASSGGAFVGNGGTSSGGASVGNGGASSGGASVGNGGTSSGGASVGNGGASSGGASVGNGGTSSGGATGSGGVNGSGGIASGGAKGSGGTSSGGARGSGGTGSGGANGSGGSACTPVSEWLPEIGGCTVFTATSPWNTDIHCAPVHPRAQAFHDAFDVDPAHRAIHLDLGSTEDFYGIPHAVVPANEATVPITYGVGGENYANESDPGPFPLPLDAHIEGQKGAVDPTGGDRHVIVVQQGSCVLYELYKAVRVASPAGFRCASSARWALDVNSTRPAGWTSADAAGLPIFPGLLRYAEIQAGAIHHALRVTAPNAQKAYIPPASHVGPNADASLPPYGLRFRLVSTFSETGYSAQAKVLIRALKTYGLIYADQGTGWYVSGSSDPGLAALIDEIHGSRPIPSSAFEAVYTGDTVCGWGSAGACN